MAEEAAEAAEIVDTHLDATNAVKMITMQENVHKEVEIPAGTATKKDISLLNVPKKEEEVAEVADAVVAVVVLVETDENKYATNSKKMAVVITEIVADFLMKIITVTMKEVVAEEKEEVVPDPAVVVAEVLEERAEVKKVTEVVEAVEAEAVTAVNVVAEAEEVEGVVVLWFGVKWFYKFKKCLSY